MLIYRARACPKCRFYLGYSVRKPQGGTREAAVESFCLSCDYRLPLRVVVDGLKKAVSGERQRKPAVTLPPKRFFGAAARSEAAAAGARPNYPQELRAIGQELERRGFTTFNLRLSGEGYFVWSTEPLEASALEYPVESASPNSVTVGRDSARGAATKRLLDRIVGFHFTARQIERLEQSGRQDRQQLSGTTAGRRLSHSLRTVGEQIHRRGQRLLAIAWREREISVVTKARDGRCSMDVLRPDNIYDLWVRMYLQRSQ
jgi:hypothetical protein